MDLDDVAFPSLWELLYLYNIYIYIYIDIDIIHMLSHKLTHRIHNIYTHMIDIHNSDTHHGDIIANDGSMAEIRCFLDV